MYQGGSGTPHLHFQRSGPEWTEEYGPTGLCNPLDYLDPDLLGEECWIFMPQPTPTEHPWCYFLEDKTIAEWGSWGNFEDIYQDTIAADELHGSVDIIQGFWLRTNGDIGAHPRLPEDWAVPHRIEWECVQLGASSSEQSIFNRYLASFDGIVGAMEDWEKYRQFYFRYMWLNDYFPLSHGDMICLTNCGEAENWDGINNIKENCWQTDSDNQFSRVTTNPVLAAFSDEPYRIDVMSYAWDTTVTHGDTLDVELHNFSPVVEEVVISCEDRTIWKAYWTADSLIPKWHNPLDLAVLPDQELDVTVVFSELMDTTSVTVTAEISSPYNDIIASDAETIFLI